MKKRLLKPPERDEEILFLPDPKEFLSSVKEESSVGVAHQPYFFNPGVSLKFLFLEKLSCKHKEIIFVDTDRADLSAKTPSASPRGEPSDGNKENIVFIKTEDVLYNFPTVKAGDFKNFFDSVEYHLKKYDKRTQEDLLSHFLRFKRLLLRNIDKRFLKEVLSESFLQFYNIEEKCRFLSDLTKGADFEDFFLKIFREDKLFRVIFNDALDEYRKEFKFRYKNFPFPKLEEDELPFWVVDNNRRVRCFKKEINTRDFKRMTLFPRASTLTMFLRLYRLDFFIHGVGGANYEWVQDRLIEKFFKHSPPRYAVISGTFYLDDYKERGFPYFLFSPEKLHELIDKFMLEIRARQRGGKNG